LNFAERLNTVDCNVLVVYGEKDDVVDSKLFNDLHVDVEHVRVIGLSGAKHFPMIDEGIKFNRLIKDFSDKLANLDSIEVKEEWRRRTR
jgi:pimeloyl-ACP methyl ester carboxylesterase